MTTPPNDPFDSDSSDEQRNQSEQPGQSGQPDSSPFDQTQIGPQAGQTQSGPQPGQDGFGQIPFGQPQYGQPQYGQNPHAQNYYAQDPYGQNPYAQNPYAQPQPGYGAPANRGPFLGALFDFSFNQLIATRVIPFLYAVITILMTIGAVVALLVAVVSGFVLMGDDQVGAGVLSIIIALIVVPLVYLLYLIIIRVVMELYISVVKINENTAQIAANTAQGPAR